jgi:hypothetical protein
MGFDEHGVVKLKRHSPEEFVIELIDFILPDGAPFIRTSEALDEEGLRRELKKAKQPDRRITELVKKARDSS